MPKHILVVDDNELNLSLMAKIFAYEGYQVTLAHNGSDAIRLVVDDKPDLIVLDVSMPDMDGFDLCRKLRQPPLIVTGPIVMLTAMSSGKERQQALQAGANDIWSKPFDMDLLRQRIYGLLTSHRSAGNL
jgi:DNA-binding response OmpR family regulator